MTLLYPTHLKIKFSSSLQVHDLCNFPLSQLSTSTVHIPSSALVCWTELVNNSYIMDVTSIFHLASFYLSWVECNRGHIIYKTVLLLTCRTCSILQRMNSTGKFIPQPTSEFMFGAILCKTVFVLPAYILRNGSCNSFLSKRANFSKEKKSSSLQSDSSWTLTRLFAPSTARRRKACSPITPYSTIQPWIYRLSALLRPSTNRLPPLHRNTSIDYLITVRKPFPRSISSHCHKQ